MELEFLLQGSFFFYPKLSQGACYMKNICYQKIYSWYSYICINTEYILYILYFYLIVIHISLINHQPIHILLSQSIKSHDKSYIFFDLDCNTLSLS